MTAEATAGPTSRAVGYNYDALADDLASWRLWT